MIWLLSKFVAIFAAFYQQDETLKKERAAKYVLHAILYKENVRKTCFNYISVFLSLLLYVHKQTDIVFLDSQKDSAFRSY